MDLMGKETLDLDKPALEQGNEEHGTGNKVYSPYDEVAPVPPPPTISEDGSATAEKMEEKPKAPGLGGQAMDFLKGKPAGDSLKLTSGVSLGIPGVTPDDDDDEPKMSPEKMRETMKSAMGETDDEMLDEEPTMGADIIPVVNNPDKPGVQEAAQAEADKVAAALATLGLPTRIHPNVQAPVVAEPMVPAYTQPVMRAPRIMR